jgi:Bacterial dipeptidyl-peptidase Sh3 domain
MPSAIARAAVAPVLADAGVRAEQVTQLVLGETATVLARSGEWRRVRTHADAYEGWVNAGYLTETSDGEVEAWRARATGWCEGAVVEREGARVPLPLRARVALEDGGVVLPDGRRGRVVVGAVRPLEAV